MDELSNSLAQGSGLKLFETSVDHSEDSGVVANYYMRVSASVNARKQCQRIHKTATECFAVDFEGEYEACMTPDKHSEVLNLQRRFANPFSLAIDADKPYDSQISPASVLPEPPRPPLKVWACCQFVIVAAYHLQSWEPDPLSCNCMHETF